MSSVLQKGAGGLGVFAALCVLLSACNLPSQMEFPFTPESSGTLRPTEFVPTPVPPPATLIVCLGREPASLYLYSPLRLYGESNREADVVLQAIYDGPIDLVGFEYQAVILEKIPSLVDGDARLEAVTVSAGDLYLNPETLLPDQLRAGNPYLASGCTDLDCSQTYQRGEVSLDRLVVDFHLLPDVKWSDGEPVTAMDSVYSYRLSAHRDTPIGKYLIDRTDSYEALDDLTTRWSGIPGFRDSEYASNFWSPLPEHILAAFSPGDLLSADEANRQPMGWGPYVIEEWIPGQQILLRKNPAYFRSSEGLPRFDNLIFRFQGASSGSAIQQVLTGECDILDETALSEEDLPTLLQMEQSGRLEVSSVPGALLERIDFNLAPVGQPSRTTVFSDVDTRRAIAGCINREAFVAEALGGLGEISNTYLPPGHPLYVSDVEGIAYDVEGSIARLEEIGWVDDDASPETPRVAQGVPGIQPGTPLAFTYLTTPGGSHAALAQQLQSDLKGCGIRLETEFRDTAEVMAPWPQGLTFGRTFETVGWSWLTLVGAPCEMFASREVASDDNPNGSNATGFRNPEYDRACNALLLGLPEDESYREGARVTQEILAAQLPAIPLFAHPRMAAYGPDICGLKVDPSAHSVLWNIEDLGAGEACGGE